MDLGENANSLKELRFKIEIKLQSPGVPDVTLMCPDWKQFWTTLMKIEK